MWVKRLSSYTDTLISASRYFAGPCRICRVYWCIFLFRPGCLPKDLSFSKVSVLHILQVVCKAS